MSEREDLGFEVDFFVTLHRRMPRDVRVASILAQLYTRTGQIDSGLRMDRKLVRLTPNDPVAHYNLACSLALKRRYPEAVRALRTAVTFGYADFDWMRNDPDLGDLHEYPEFLRLLHEVDEG